MRILYECELNPIHLKKSSHKINFTGHLQRAQLKTEM